jgi:hypothetical protein
MVEVSVAPPAISLAKKLTVSYRFDNEARGGASGRPPAGSLDRGHQVPKQAPAEGGGRGRLIGSLGRRVVPLVVGLLLLALVVGAVLLWRSYGDRAGGTSVYEDSVESGAEPVVRITNGPGRVRVEGVEKQENVKISAKRYARGSSPASAKENAARVPVDITHDGSTLEISSDGGRGTGADYELKVPSGSTVEVESATGDVEVSDLANDVTIRAQEGDVTVKNVKGSVMIEAPQGDVMVEAVSTETGNAEITVGAGDLDLKDLVIGLMEARVEAGDVNLSGRFSGGGRVFVETGSINARLPSGDAKDLDLETRVGEVTRKDEQGSG